MSSCYRYIVHFHQDISKVKPSAGQLLYIADLKGHSLVIISHNMKVVIIERELEGISGGFLPIDKSFTIRSETEIQDIR